MPAVFVQEKNEVFRIRRGEGRLAMCSEVNPVGLTDGLDEVAEQQAITRMTLRCLP